VLGTSTKSLADDLFDGSEEDGKISSGDDIVINVNVAPQAKVKEAAAASASLINWSAVRHNLTLPPWDWPPPTFWRRK